MDDLTAWRLVSMEEFSIGCSISSSSTCTEVEVAVEEWRGVQVEGCRDGGVYRWRWRSGEVKRWESQGCEGGGVGGPPMGV